jgi:hypothetical protein
MYGIAGLLLSAQLRRLYAGVSLLEDDLIFTNQTVSFEFS